MSTSNESLEAVNGNTLKVFLKFTIPNMIGFIAMSSCGIVDGIFVGKFVSNTALGAVNIIIPMFTFVFGIAIMLTIGAAVIVGKYLGESNYEKASDVFTKVITAIAVISITMTIICGFFGVSVAKALGANADLLPYATSYLKMLSLFFFFQAAEYSLSVFVRVDGNPYLASFAVILGAIVNFILDYIFILKVGMGIEGAALATGISYTLSFIILSTHFITKKGNLRLKFADRKWGVIKKATYNGSSELISEASSGILAFLFNWIMILKIGTKGVEAFTVINYAIWVANMLCYSIGDSVVPLMSINYGAQKPKRIMKFLWLALLGVIGIGLSLFLVLTFIPDKLIGLFLNRSNKEAFEIALVFASYIKYSFLFSGMCIIFSSYFTSHHKPLESVVIASLRGLVLPVIFLGALPFVFRAYGIYMAIPLADICTLVVAILLWKRFQKTKKTVTV